MSKRSKVSGTFTVIGIILGIAIGYFASGGSPAWIAGVAVAGGIGGYFMGRYFDKDTKK